MSVQWFRSLANGSGLVDASRKAMLCLGKMTGDGGEFGSSLSKRRKGGFQLFVKGAS